MSSPPCVTDSHTNMEAIKQKLLSVIINMLECDGTNFIFVLEPHTYALIVTRWKGRGALPTAGLWTEVLSYRQPATQAGGVPGQQEEPGEASLAFSQALGCRGEIWEQKCHQEGGGNHKARAAAGVS